MEHVAKKFEVVIFTASQRVYAERLLDILDPGQRVRVLLARATPSISLAAYCSARPAAAAASRRLTCAVPLRR